SPAASSKSGSEKILTQSSPRWNRGAGRPCASSSRRQAMARSKDQARKQLAACHADPLPGCVAITHAPATPGQLAAWRRLWRLLLMESVDDNESPARGDKGEHH